MDISEEIKRFSTQLKFSRIAAKLTQTELANQMNASRDLIARMERGENIGSHYLLAAIKALGGYLVINMYQEFDEDKLSQGLDKIHYKLITEEKNY